MQALFTLAVLLMYTYKSNKHFQSVAVYNVCVEVERKAFLCFLPKFLCNRQQVGHFHLRQVQVAHTIRQQQPISHTICLCTYPLVPLVCTLLSCTTCLCATQLYDLYVHYLVVQLVCTLPSCVTCIPEHWYTHTRGTIVPGVYSWRQGCE